MQLCVWDADGWKKLANKTLHSFQTGQVPDPPVVNYIEFHKDQIHLLAVSERQIDIYEAPLLNHCIQVCKWLKLVMFLILIGSKS